MSERSRMNEADVEPATQLQELEGGEAGFVARP